MGGSRSALALARACLVTDAASARRMSELFASNVATYIYIYNIYIYKCKYLVGPHGCGISCAPASVATQLVLLLLGFVVAGVLRKQMSNVPYRS